MVVTLSFEKIDIPVLLRELSAYPELPAPSPYEKARHQVGECRVTLYTSGKVVIQGKSPHSEEGVKKTVLSWVGETGELIFGIDETGRGEREGPLVVSGVVGKRSTLRGLRDSKKTGDIKKKYAEATGESALQLSASVNAETIDYLREAGWTMNEIEAVIAEHFHQLVQKIFPESQTIMDGQPLKRGMKGIVFREKADDVEPSVSAASIIAKHIRNESGDHGERKTWKRK